MGFPQRGGTVDNEVAAAGQLALDQRRQFRKSGLHEREILSVNGQSVAAPPNREPTERQAVSVSESPAPGKSSGAAATVGGANQLPRVTVGADERQ